MSYSNRKKHESKKYFKQDKNDKNEFIKSVVVAPKSESYNNDKEFSLFTLKNLDLILNSKPEEKESNIEQNNEIENENNNSSNVNNNKYLIKCISCPEECHSVPLIMINSSKNSISSQCPANGQSNELTNPHDPDEITEIPINLNIF